MATLAIAPRSCTCLSHQIVGAPTRARRSPHPARLPCARRREPLLSTPVLQLAAVFGLAAALAPAGAGLEWSVPPGCPSRPAVEAAASALLGRPLAGAPDLPPGARIEARGVVAREPGGFRLDLEVRSPAGLDRRTLRDRRCDVLGESAALILATAVDPSLSPAGPPPTLPPEPSGTWPIEPVPSTTSEVAPPVEPPPALTRGPDPVAPDPLAAPAPLAAPDPLAAPAATPATPPPGPVPSRVPPSWPATQASLRLAGVFDHGSLTGPTGGFDLAAGLLRRVLRVELHLGFLAPRELRLDPSRPAGVRLSLWTASIRACGVARLERRVGLATCAAVEAGALVGSAFGVANARTRAQPWLAAAIGPELMLALRPRLALALALDAVLPALRAPFTLAGQGIVFAGHPAAFRALAGVRLRFP